VLLTAYIVTLYRLAAKGQNTEEKTANAPLPQGALS
jgi:cbb3-type cytochrome oxidase subunit 3